ncbi:kinase-like domain-containing protein [Radiomyces spectabilis]|uniref:kinase-like domain-containing protein n=1 Tax=Radiomyces spectabilis TaxID=64574 RepID=UPI00221F10B3|nr:kinase-like domain-containing protein [Radiomyces spectabilis]KAI8369296.1 kinase-like domain-containing protein [Radiomyces spectabilis]
MYQIPPSDMNDSVPSDTLHSQDDSDHADAHGTTGSATLMRQLAAQFPEYERAPHIRSQMAPFGGVWMNPNQEMADHSQQPDAEKVIEVAPNGRYAKLNTFLGKGAYKVVYKAIDREEGYEVAWNVIQATRQEFKDLGHEIEILKSVRHPNIITFHDAWYNDTEFIFITELMTSGTLREYIRKLSPSLNMKIIKRWCRQILKGLVYLHAHEPPIIHRDIKCDNIFINGAHGEIKIGDMGTAEMKIGKKYTVIGTPEFMAPEMYEEKGYSEKVDIYAFGMCLLEMVTGEYPYGECTNAAQVFKKVTRTIRPECLSRVQNEDVLALINNCLTTENDRMTAQEILEHSFLAVEPEVVLLSKDMTEKLLTLQVVFKGMDKLSVKFEFNSDTDTAEDVVAEMIEEQVLPDRYQQLITNEINRILRDINKQHSSNKREDERIVWRRENDIRSELEKAKYELDMARLRTIEAEKKCDALEQRTLLAEERFKETMAKIEQFKLQQQEQTAATFEKLSPTHDTLSRSSGVLGDQAELAATHSALMDHVLAEYANDTSIEKFVIDTAVATNRSMEKAKQWATKLQNQDIMTVGDLRDLHDEDWSGIGLTVFALRALKNMLTGKTWQSGLPRSPQPAPASGSSTPVEEQEML